jgi:hypothetical protein
MVQQTLRSVVTRLLAGLVSWTIVLGLVGYLIFGSAIFDRAKAIVSSARQAIGDRIAAVRLERDQKANAESKKALAELLQCRGNLMNQAKSLKERRALLVERLESDQATLRSMLDASGESRDMGPLLKRLQREHEELAAIDLGILDIATVSQSLEPQIALAEESIRRQRGELDLAKARLVARQAQDQAQTLVTDLDRRVVKFDY